MVRFAGMSKRCKTCKDRKIKCDEKLPNCSQCEKGGRTCTGPVNGLIFLSTTPDAQRQRALKISSRKRSQDVVGRWPGSFVISNPAKSVHSDDSELSDGYAVDTLIRAVDTGPFPLDNDRRIAPSTAAGLTSYQPSLAPALEQHFLSNFISFFDKPTPNSKPLKGWFSLLPTMLSNTIRSYVRAPILTASLALYGTLAHEQAIVLIAYKWYGVGLNRQRKRLIDGWKREQSMIPTVEDISMALLSAYFEVFFSTTSEAYFQHQIGASKLLEARGPEDCQTGVLHELFQTVRFHMIFVTMITHKPSIFATEQWLTIPFAKRSKTVDDRVVDVLTVMPETLLSSGITGTSATSSTAYEHGFEFSSQAISFIGQLEALWPEVEALLISAGLNYEGFATYAGDDMQLIQMWRCTPTGFDYPDLPTATTIAFYHLAWTLILSPVCGSEAGRQRYGSLIMAHCASILAVATFVDGNNNGSVYNSGCSYLRMVFPLRIICLISPSLMQRQSAWYRLERWRTVKGMGGICAVALASSESQDWQLNLDQI